MSNGKRVYVSPHFKTGEEVDEALHKALSALQDAPDDGTQYLRRNGEWQEAGIGRVGLSAYEVAVENGYEGTETQWLKDLEGESAYEIWLLAGNTGTVEDYLKSLEGSDGVNTGEVFTLYYDMAKDATELDLTVPDKFGVRYSLKTSDSIQNIKVTYEGQLKTPGLAGDPDAFWYLDILNDKILFRNPLPTNATVTVSHVARQGIQGTGDLYLNGDLYVLGSEGIQTPRVRILNDAVDDDEAVRYSQLVAIGGANWLQANDKNNFQYAPVASGEDAIALGNLCRAYGKEGIAIGWQCYANAPNSISIGRNNHLDVNNPEFSIAIGTSNSLTYSKNVSIGHDCNLNSDASSVVIGDEAKLTNSFPGNALGSIAIGKNIWARSFFAGPDSVVTIGKNIDLDVSAVTERIVIKTDTAGLRVHNDGTLETSSDGGTSWDPISVDTNNWMSANKGSDFPTAPRAISDFDIAIGEGAFAGSGSSFGRNIAIGYEAITDQYYTIAIGNGASVTNNSGIAIGSGARADLQGVAIGLNATTGVTSNAIAIGRVAEADSTNKIVLLTFDAGLRVKNDGTLETTSDGGTVWDEISAVGGTVWHSGSGAPDPGLGVEGDFYLDLDVSDYYGPKTAGSWGSPVSLIGPPGQDGTSVTIKGSDTWANISALPSPDEGDTWILTEATGAPDQPDGSPAEIGDGVTWTGAAWINTGPLQGPKGDDGLDGADGRTWWSGSGVPGSGLGEDGDFYLDIDVDTYYGPKTGGVWGAGTPLIGEKGEKGDKGDQGDPGQDGQDGSGIQFQGSDTWANISAIPTPNQGDAWILTDPTGAPNAPGDVPAAIGDWVIYNGASWDNTGPREGEKGDKGDQGDVGPEGPSTPSTDANNRIVVGTDSLLYAPPVTYGEITGKPATFPPSAHDADHDTHNDARYLQSFSDDDSPEAGGDIQVGGTNNYAIRFTDLTGGIRGGIGWADAFSGVGLGYTAGPTFDPTDGGIVLKSGTVELYGTQFRVESLKHSDSLGYRQVRVTDEGLVYDAPVGPLTWHQVDTGTDVVQITAPLFTWHEVSGLEIILEQDVAADDILRVDATIFVRNASTNRSGEISLGLGIDAAEPNNPTAPHPIAPDFSGAVPVGWTFTGHGGLTTGQRLAIWVRRESQEHSAFDPFVDGNVGTHELVISVSGTSGGLPSVNLDTILSANSVEITNTGGSNATIGAAVPGGNAGLLTGTKAEEYDNKADPINWLAANVGLDFATAPSAGGGNAIAIGDGAIADSYGTIAIGGGAGGTGNTFTYGQRAIAIGDGATANGQRVIAIGDGAGSTSRDLLDTTAFSIAIGQDARIGNTFENAIALGNNTFVGATDGIVIGSGATAYDGITIGNNSNPQSAAITGAIILGDNVTNQAGVDSIGIGHDCFPWSEGSVVLGSKAKETKAAGATQRNILIGYNSSSKARDCIIIGSELNDWSSDSDDNILVGHRIEMSGFSGQNVVIANDLRIDSNLNSVVIGYGTSLSSSVQGAVVVGEGASATGGNPVAIGKDAVSGAGLSIGPLSESGNHKTTAVGREAKALQEDTVAIGYRAGSALDMPTGGISIGASSYVGAADGIAIGRSAGVFNGDAIAIGASALAHSGVDADTKILLQTSDAALRIKPDGTLETSADGGTSWSEIVSLIESRQRFDSFSGSATWDFLQGPKGMSMSISGDVTFESPSNLPTLDSEDYHSGVITLSNFSGATRTLTWHVDWGADAPDTIDDGVVMEIPFINTGMSGLTTVRETKRS